MNRYKREGVAKIRAVALPHVLHNFGDTHARAMAGAAAARRLGLRNIHAAALKAAKLARTDGHRAIVLP